MIHHLVLFKLKPDVTAGEVDSILRQTRAQLLKIDDVLMLRCGRNLDPGSIWELFVSIELENTEKLAQLREDAIYIKYLERILKPKIEDQIALTFEMEPGRGIQFS